MRKNELLLQLIIFGTTAAIVFLIVVRVYPPQFVNHQKKESPKLIEQTIKIISPPTSISIPDVNLNLPVSAATIVNNQWTLYDDRVSWLTTSKMPGEGNVILFAHNKSNLFGNLKKVETGAEITVQSRDKKYSYLVTEKRKVTPNDVGAVLSNKDQLTLYTCDGSFDQKRLIVIAVPKLI